MIEMLTPHFSKEEMACKCGHKACDAVPMLPTFLAKLENLRQKFGALTPVSAARCRYHNTKVGGAFRSQHIFGNACDFHINDYGEFKKLIDLAVACGFKGIGQAKQGIGLIHIDDRKNIGRWEYA